MFYGFFRNGQDYNWPEVGTVLERYFNNKGVKKYLLDGDEVRDLLDRDL